MQGCNQEPRCNPDAFGHVIVFVSRPVRCLAVPLRKHHNQPGRSGQVRLVNTCADRLQCCQPFITGPTCIKRTLFVFGGGANLRFHRRILDCRKMPRLMIGATWRKACGLNTGYDHRFRHILDGKLPHRMALCHVIAKSLRCQNRCVRGQLHPVWQRHRLIRNLSLAIHISRPRSTPLPQRPKHPPAPLATLRAKTACP